MQAEFNLHTNQLILYLDRKLTKEEWERFTRELRMSWGRGRKCFYGVWAPEREDAILEYAGAIEVIIDDDAGYKDRLGRFERYAGSAQQRAEQQSRAAKADLEGIPPGQPILVGHHSEKGHRAALERHDRHMSRMFEEQHKSDYWQQRLQAAQANRQQREKPQTIYNRIQKYEKALRNWQKRPESDSRARWVAHLETVIEYQQALYQESGMLPLDAGLSLEVGGAVRNPHHPGEVWVPIIKVNVRSVTVLTTFDQWSDPFTETVAKEKIKEALSKAAYQQHPHWTRYGQEMWAAHERQAKADKIHKGDAIRYRYTLGGGDRWQGPVEVQRDNPKTITVLERRDRYEELRPRKLEKWNIEIEVIPAKVWIPQRDRQALRIEMERHYIEQGWQNSARFPLGPAHPWWPAAQGLAEAGVIEPAGANCWLLSAEVRRKLIDEKHLFQEYPATGMIMGRWLNGLAGEVREQRTSFAREEVARLKP